MSCFSGQMGRKEKKTDEVIWGLSRELKMEQEMLEKGSEKKKKKKWGEARKRKNMGVGRKELEKEMRNGY